MMQILLIWKWRISQGENCLVKHAYKFTTAGLIHSLVMKTGPLFWINASVD